MKNAGTVGVERDFPGWLVWVSRQGLFWGAVRRDVTPDVPQSVIADSEEELRALLVRQRADGSGR